MQLEKICKSFKGKQEELIPLLQAVQNEFGYISSENMEKIAEFLRMPPSKVFSVATFYSQFRFTPIGKNHVMMCRGTACHIKDAPRMLSKVKEILGIEEGQVTKDGKFSLETVACIGACGLAPTMVINGQTYGRLTTKKVAEIIETIKSKD